MEMAKKIKKEHLSKSQKHKVGDLWIHPELEVVIRLIAIDNNTILPAIKTAYHVESSKGAIFVCAGRAGFKKMIDGWYKLESPSYVQTYLH